MSHYIDIHSDNTFTVSSTPPAAPIGTVYPAEYTPVLTAASDEVCEQATSFILTDGVAYLQNSLRKKTAAEIEAETEAYLSNTVDDFMDSKAKEKRYNDRFTFALRAAIPSSPWHAEGLAFATWMDQVNAYCYQVVADVKSGLRPVPTAEELIAELPALGL